MKTRILTKLFALMLCAALLLTFAPATAFALDDVEPISMTEGDVRTAFAPAGVDCTSSDPSVAWVDENGSLNALKPGTVTISVPSDGGDIEYTVNVSDYTDGSDVVGNLKILARYNDSMQFYDGHVYLLFTSYQDGVEIAVPDLYGAYEISDDYYRDISADISNGSNHTGNDTEKYFTFDKTKNSVTLDRGEIVTIGMYRGFDLSVPKAALGTVMNSSGWKKLEKAGKTETVKAVFDFLDKGKISVNEAKEKLMAVFNEVGSGNYTQFLDGVVEGGVCFNRELYNQKLEWDQYENVTYNMDITRNQLNVMTMYLRGNLNNFSIMKNSCATVALRAWNAAVGTRNGGDTAYKLSCAGKGIYSMVDAPKGVRDNIVKRLPGYYLNNAQGVAEPDAGYQDDTGWVYVSAPKRVTPINYTYENDDIIIDNSRTKVSYLQNIARGNTATAYSIDGQDVAVKINTSSEGGLNSVDSIDFTVNGTAYTLNGESELTKGVWFKVKVENPVEGEEYYARDAEGRIMQSFCDNGTVSFYSESLPAVYKIVSASQSPKNILDAVVIGGDKVSEPTAIYTKNDDETVDLIGINEIEAGTDIYIKTGIDEFDWSSVLDDITLNGESIVSPENYDEDEQAYHITKPAGFVKLTVEYVDAELTEKGYTCIQANVGDELNVNDYAKLLLGEDKTPSDKLKWAFETYEPSDDEDYEEPPVCAELVNPTTLKITSEGYANVFVCAANNERLRLSFYIEGLENTADMISVNYEDNDQFQLAALAPDAEDESGIMFPGYLIKKGSVISVCTLYNDNPAKVVSGVTCNGKTYGPTEPFTVNENCEISVELREAEILGMPETINLSAKGDTYKLGAYAVYKDTDEELYDGTISYESSNEELVTVDENGLVTVVDDIPEDGDAVIITACSVLNDGVRAESKVEVGNFDDDRIVGRLTISARPIYKGELVAHGCLTFTTYEDTDLDVSYYHYHKPNEKYDELMRDYIDHPENYSQNPAAYNGNEPALEDRESYFDVFTNGAESEPQTISLKAGESITMSNYGFDRTNLTIILNTLKGSTLSYISQDARDLITQLEKYLNDEEFDGTIAFDSLVKSLVNMYMYASMMGVNPVDAHTDGGLEINRELYNQFIRNDSQLPNNYYSVDITADQLVRLKNYLSNYENNYYSLFNMNCATGVVAMWNTTFADCPELQLNASLTGIAKDPESLYLELGLLRLKGLDIGEGGKDFLPTTAAFSDEAKEAIAKINAIGAVELTPECEAKILAAREAYNAVAAGEKNRIYNYSVLTAAEDKYNALNNVEPNPTEPNPTEPNPTEPNPTEPEPTEPKPTEPKPTEPKPTEPEPTPEDSAKKSIKKCTVTGIKAKTYTGKAKTQAVVVKDGAKTLKKGVDYTVSYKNNKNAGKATVIIKGTGGYTSCVKKSFTIRKAANPMKVKTVTKTVKYATLKKKSVKVKPLKVTKAKGKKSFTKVLGKKKTAAANKKFTLKKSTGKIVVRKGLKKGTYTFKVKVKAKGSANYKAKSKTVKVTIKVK